MNSSAKGSYYLTTPSGEHGFLPPVAARSRIRAGHGARGAHDFVECGRSAPGSRGRVLYAKQRRRHRFGAAVADDRDTEELPGQLLTTRLIEPGGYARDQRVGERSGGLRVGRERSER